MAFQVLPPTHAYSSSVVSPMCENRSLRQHSRGLWWAGASVGWWESGGGQKTRLAACSWLPSPLELSQFQKEWQHFVFYSLSQRTTLNIRCHLVKVIWTIQHHPFHEWISAPVPVTVHKSTTWACGFYILRQMLLIDNDGLWGGSHFCSHDAAMGKAMENDRLMGKKDSSPKLATDLFLYYLTIIYKELHLGGGAKLACK